MSGYFKTGPQQYAAGDRFLGIRVPAIRKLARTCHGLSLEDLDCLLKSRWHEERLLALVILVARHRKSSPEDQRTLCRFYLSRTSSINNWDLVDISAGQIVGGTLDPKLASWNASRIQPAYGRGASLSSQPRSGSSKQSFHPHFISPDFSLPTRTT